MRIELRPARQGFMGSHMLIDISKEELLALSKGLDVKCQVYIDGELYVASLAVEK